MKKLKILLATISVALLAVVLVPFAKADLRDEWTVVTFKQPVEIPGMILPAGKYIFRLMDPDNSLTSVEVINAKTDRSCEIIEGIPDFHSHITNNAEFVLDKGIGKGSPEMLHSWIYPGIQEGLEFYYPHSK